MRLKALDQVHISSVKRDAISTGEEFEVTDSMGKELLKKHPKLFSAVTPADEAEASEKAEPSDLQNKAEHPPANKSETKRSTK